MKYTEAYCQQLDASDPLRSFRDAFQLPAKDIIYLCSNSLGLPAKSALPRISERMEEWASLGAGAWFDTSTDWYSVHEGLKAPLAEIIGAKASEVVVMNNLTTNLHLLLSSFYRPTAKRYKILMEGLSFPSDRFALQSHIKQHHFNLAETMLTIGSENNTELMNTEDILQIIHQHGSSIALVYLNPINFLTGQVLDMAPICALAKEKGCVIGFDLAHAAGNIPLHLHEWSIDFAVGCTYKYLCAGPGAPGFAFVHEKHHQAVLPTLHGWWGYDANERFKMQQLPTFVPAAGANGWQLSTPSILAAAPLEASLALFAATSIQSLRQKSQLQTEVLLSLMQEQGLTDFELLTPEDPRYRGAQLSFKVHDAKFWYERLKSNKIYIDTRPPNVLRITPSPFYTTFAQLYALVLRIRGL